MQAMLMDALLNQVIHGSLSPVFRESPIRLRVTSPRRVSADEDIVLRPNIQCLHQFVQGHPTGICEARGAAGKDQIRDLKFNPHRPWQLAVQSSTKLELLDLRKGTEVTSTY